MRKFDLSNYIYPDVDYDRKPSGILVPSKRKNFHTISTPVGAPKGNWNNLVGKSWTPTTSPETLVKKSGIAVSNDTGGYNTRIQDYDSNKPLSIGFLFESDNLSISPGIWSISAASTPTSSSPYILVRKTTSTVQLWYAGGYRISTTANSISINTRHSLSISLSSFSGSTNAILILDGVVYKAGPFTQGATKPDEYLGAGYNVVSAIFIYNFWSTQDYMDEDTLLYLNRNPYSVYENSVIEVFDTFASGTPNTQSITTTSSSSQSIYKSVLKNILFSSSSNIVLVKSILDTLLFTSSSVISVLKSVLKSIASSSTGSASVQAAIVLLKSIFATSTSSQVLSKSVLKIISSTSSLSVSITNSILKVITFTSSSTVSLLKSVLKIISTTSSNTISIQSAIIYVLSISSTVSSVVSLQALRVLLKSISTTASSSVLYTKDILFNIVSSSVSNIVLVRGIYSTMLFTASSIVSISNTVLKNIFAVSSSTVVYTRSILKNILSTSTSILSIIRQLLGFTNTVKNIVSKDVSIANTLSRDISIANTLSKDVDI